MKFYKTVIPFLKERLSFKYDIVAPVVATLLVLVSGTFVAFLVAQSQATQNRDSQDAYLLEQQQRINDNLTQRLSAYEQTLRSGASLVRITNSVTRDQWNEYISGLGVEERFPGTSGLGFLERVEPSELAAFEKARRAEGFTNYEIFPEEKTDVYFPITYVEPLTETNKNALGFNLYSDPVRRRTLDIARDSGELAMTPPLRVRNADLEYTETAIVAVYPVYDSQAQQHSEAQRQAALRGYTYVLLRMEGFGPRIADNLDNSGQYGYMISDVDDGDEQIMYESETFKELQESGGGVTSERTVQVLGREWKVSILLDAEQFGSRQINPVFVFIAGMVLNAAGAGFLFVLMVHRQARIAMSHEQEVQKTKDDLLALASHQLRTPATGVKQYVGMVLAGYAGKINKEQRSMLEKANESNERQLQIINQLLYVAKADAGQLKVDPEKFDVVEVMAQVVDEQKESAHAQNTKVKFQKHKPLQIHADPHHVRMILENLLSNAIKYSDEKGKVEVYFSNWRERVAVHVSDNGVGISESERELLFQKFSRIENKQSRRVGGSGIGLFLAQQLANANNGEIVVESEVGEGSTFTLHIAKRPKK